MPQVFEARFFRADGSPGPVDVSVPALMQACIFLWLLFAFFLALCFGLCLVEEFCVWSYKKISQFEAPSGNVTGNGFPAFDRQFLVHECIVDDRHFHITSALSWPNLEDAAESMPPTITISISTRNATFDIPAQSSRRGPPTIAISIGTRNATPDIPARASRRAPPTIATSIDTRNATPDIPARASRRARTASLESSEDSFLPTPPGSSEADEPHTVLPTPLGTSDANEPSMPLSDPTPVAPDSNASPSTAVEHGNHDLDDRSIDATVDGVPHGAHLDSHEGIQDEMRSPAQGSSGHDSYDMPSPVLESIPDSLIAASNDVHTYQDLVGSPASPSWDLVESVNTPAENGGPEFMLRANGSAHTCSCVPADWLEVANASNHLDGCEHGSVRGPRYSVRLTDGRRVGERTNSVG